MCLYATQKDDARMKRLFKRTKSRTIKMWKVLKWIDGELCNPYQRQPVHKGVFRSNRKSTALYKYEINKAKESSHIEVRILKSYAIIDKGIHVFLTIKDAKSESRTHDGTKIVPVYCEKKDFVAAGQFCNLASAVFTRVRYNEEDLTK